MTDNEKVAGVPIDDDALDKVAGELFPPRGLITKAAKPTRRRAHPKR